MKKVLFLFCVLLFLVGANTLDYSVEDFDGHNSSSIVTKPISKRQVNRGLFGIFSSLFTPGLNINQQAQYPNRYNTPQQPQRVNNPGIKQYANIPQQNSRPNGFQSFGFELNIPQQNYRPSFQSPSFGFGSEVKNQLSEKKL